MKHLAAASCSSAVALVLTLVLTSAMVVASTVSGNDADMSSSDISSSSSARPPRRQHRPASSSRRKSANPPAEENTCTLYLAPTYAETPDEVNLEDMNTYESKSKSINHQPISMGVYAGVDLPANTPLGHTDMVIPIVEIWSHIMHRNFQATSAQNSNENGNTGGDELQTRDALDVLSTGHHGLDYHMSSLLWEPHHLGGAVTVGHGYDAKALSPGFGSLIRSASSSTGDESQNANINEGSAPRDITEVKEAEANVRHGQVHSEREGVHRTDPTAGVS